MLKAEILEAIFVAGSILAGMTGSLLTKLPGAWHRESLSRLEFVNRGVSIGATLGPLTKF